MKKKAVFFVIILLVLSAAFAVWVKYSYFRNIETAAESKETLVGLDKKDVLARLGKPAAWGALDDRGAGYRREVFLYTTWVKNLIIILHDDKVVEVKLKDIPRRDIRNVRSLRDLRYWASSVMRLLFTREEPSIGASLDRQ